MLVGCLAWSGVVAVAATHEPMYVVNGEVMASIDHIPHEDIESIDVVPADEEAIARWGQAASDGVYVVTLRYHTAAHFSSEGINNFTDYLVQHVRWDATMPAERVSMRLTVDTNGTATICEVLQSTSRQFFKRVAKAVAEAPRWAPAMRDGEAVESIHLVNIQLPVGKELLTEPGVIIR